VVYVFGALLNKVFPDAFDIALEAASIGVVFTWASIFVCQIRLRQLSDRGVVPASPFRTPGSPWTSYLGLVFLALVIIGMAISGWQASPYLSHKVNFLVVVFGIPILAVLLAIGWQIAKPRVIANTGGRIKAVWSNDGPTYGPGVGIDTDSDTDAGTDADTVDPATPSGGGN
jgi:L-asparagine permease